jgi:hypothetical protein
MTIMDSSWEPTSVIASHDTEPSARGGPLNNPIGRRSPGTTKQDRAGHDDFAITPNW